MRGLGYLASPYMHESKVMREARFKAVAYIGAQLMQRGHHFICPISMCHPMSMSSCSLPGDFEFWSEFDKNIISRCDHFIVVPLPGWTKSEGIKREFKIARAFGQEMYLVKLGEEYKVSGVERIYHGELNAALER